MAALAVTNVMALGNGKGFRGQWTATLGDAAATIACGYPVTQADFKVNKTSGPVETVKVSGLGTSTLTVYTTGTVTDGYFKVEF